MGIDLYCKGQKTLSKEGWDNWDRIFNGSKTKDRREDEKEDHRSPKAVGRD